MKKIKNDIWVAKNFETIKERILIRDNNGKNNLVIYRNVGHLNKMTDKQYAQLLELIISEFKTSHYESFCGSGERHVGLKINWSRK